MNLQEFIDHIYCPVCKKSLIHKDTNSLWFYSTYFRRIHIKSNGFITKPANKNLYDKNYKISSFCNYDNHNFSIEFTLIRLNGAFVSAEHIYSMILFRKEEIYLESFFIKNISYINDKQYPLIPFNNISPDKLKKYMIFS